MDNDELRVLIRDQHALTVRIGSESLTDRTGPTGRWYDVSIAWNDPPTRRQIDLWVDACLPENGRRREYERRSWSRLREQDIDVARLAPHDAVMLAWSNPDDEYPGAVSFESIYTSAHQPEYRPLDDTQIGARLHEASMVADERLENGTGEHTTRAASLSGMRGKIGLALLDGRWHTAHGAALSSWVAKHEDNPRLPGEAGVESICQRATGLLGIPAAQTVSRVFAGQQCVLSRRADRHHDPRAGIRAIHQEDFAQATSWPGSEKYERGSKNEPRWKEAYAVLRTHGLDPDAEQTKLTRMLAITWVLGHSDLHRRNLGFTHHPTTGAPRISLAPAYDVSSVLGSTYDKTLAIGIAGARTLHDIGPKQWITHAEQCDIDREHTLAIVRETLRNAPQALDQARTLAHAEDENRLQATVDRRMEKLIAYTLARGQEFTSREARKTRNAGRPADVAWRAGNEAARYLKGDGARPGLDAAVREIADERLRGSGGTSTPTHAHRLPIYSRLRPHTRLRPKEENERRLDRENLGPVRSTDAARAASQMLAQALDRYQAERYGRNEDGTPRDPPPTESFKALTAAGRRKRRDEYIEEVVRHWRTRIEHKLVRDIRKTVVPLEVEFRQALARAREEDRRASEEHLERIARHERSSPSRTPVSKSRGRD